jgi:hypothetical protein
MNGTSLLMVLSTKSRGKRRPTRTTRTSKTSHAHYIYILFLFFIYDSLSLHQMGDLDLPRSCPGMMMLPVPRSCWLNA